MNKDHTEHINKIRHLANHFDEMPHETKDIVKIIENIEPEAYEKAFIITEVKIKRPMVTRMKSGATTITFIREDIFTGEHHPHRMTYDLLDDISKREMLYQIANALEATDMATKKDNCEL